MRCIIEKKEIKKTAKINKKKRTREKQINGKLIEMICYNISVYIIIVPKNLISFTVQRPRMNCVSFVIFNAF